MQTSVHISNGIEERIDEGQLLSALALTLFKSEPIPSTILQAKVQALRKYHIPSGYISYRDFRTGYLLVKALETLQVAKVTGEEVKIDLEPKSVEIYDEGELPVSREIKALITAIS